MKKIISILFCSIILGLSFVSADDACLDDDDFKTFSVVDISGSGSDLRTYFTRQFMVLQFSHPECEHCKNLAQDINSNTQLQRIFQNRRGSQSTCNYLAVVDTGNLGKWLDVVGLTSTVGINSREYVGNEYLNIPTLYDGASIEYEPTIIVINRKGEIVASKIGYDEGNPLPSNILTICKPRTDCIDEPDPSDPEQGGGKCGGGKGTGGDNNGDNDGDNDDGDNDDGDNDDGDNDDGDNDDGDNDDGDNDDGDNNDGDNDDGDNDDGDNNDGDNDDGDNNDGDNNDGDNDDGDNNDGDNNDGGSTGGSTGGFTKIGRLQIEIPWEASSDIYANESILTANNSKNSYRAIIKLVNQWLWIIIGAVLMIVIVYAGFQLFFSMGDTEKVKTALKTILYAFIGLAIALLSYIIINIIVNLF